MMYFFVDFARNFELMIANLTSSPYHNNLRYRKLAALSRRASNKANDWIVEIGTHSFDSCIKPALDFIENILNVIQDSLAYLTDIQILNYCDQTEATIELKRLEDKQAVFDGEDAEKITLTNDLEAHLQIFTASQPGVEELHEPIETLQNYMTELKNSAMYEILHALAESKQEHETQKVNRNTRLRKKTGTRDSERKQEHETQKVNRNTRLRK